MSRGGTFSALQSAIEQDLDFAIDLQSNIEMILKAGLTPVGEWPLAGSAKVHDPTFIQLAAILGKPKCLIKLIQKALTDPKDWDPILTPRGSNTKAHLLTLCVSCTDEEQGCICLEAVLKLMKEQRGEITMQHLLGEDATSSWRSPLYEAVRLKREKCVRILHNYGACPLYSSAGMKCPLLLAAQLSDAVWDAMTEYFQEHKGTRLKFGDSEKTLAEWCDEPVWNPRTLLFDGSDGESLLTLCSQINLKASNDLRGILGAGKNKEELVDAVADQPQIHATPAGPEVGHECSICGADATCEKDGVHYCDNCYPGD